MKKTVKRNLLTISAIAFAFALSTGAAVANSVNASAETLGVTDNFYMTDGASIRVKGGQAPSGIRWEATVTEAYYNQITENGTKSVTFGTYVDNAEVVETATSTRISIPCTATPNFADGVWSFYASITYDDLKDRLETKYAEAADKDAKVEAGLQAAYETVLYARAYVTVDETTTLAESADTGRSIKGVAAYCLIENTDDVTSDNQSAFETYAGGAYTVVDAQAFNNVNAYNVTTATGTLTVGAADGEYDVYLGAKSFDKATVAGGKVTVSGLGTVAGEMAKITLVNEDNQVTTVPFISATHIIGDQAEGVADQEEWAAEMSYDAQAATTQDRYVVVVKDMDLGGSDRGKGRGDARFFGRFNGLGHTISNYQVAGDQRGLFGSFGSVTDHGVTIENVALTGVTIKHTNAYPIAEYVYGTMHQLKNIYVEATYTVAGANQGVWRNTGAANVRNCIANLTYATAPEKAYAFSDSSFTASYFYDCYAVTNATETVFSKATDGNKATPATHVASSMGDLFATIKADINDENGFGQYWSADDYSLQFGDNEVWQNKTTVETLYQDTDTTISPETLVGGTVDKVLLNGEEITLDGPFAWDVSEYTAGAVNTLTVYGNGKIVEQPFVTCTYAIDTAEELQAFFQFNKGNQNTCKIQTAGWYVVLREDIDMNGAVVTAVNHTTGPADYPWGGLWQGTFNGLGHVIANLKTNGQGGVFGTFAGGTVENVAFVGVEHSGDSYMFTNYGRNTMGYIRNVYIEGIATRSSGYTAVIRGNNITVSNLIVNVNRTNLSDTNVAYAFGTELGGDHGSNLYVIGNLTRISEKSGRNFNTELYSTVAAWATDNAANITAANGWNMDCWHFSGSDLYFGVKKVEDVTYTAVGADTIVLPN